MDRERALLIEFLDCAFNKRSWHGPNLRSSVRGVDARMALVRIGKRKTIWEQVLHAAFWKQQVASKLGAPERLPWVGQNWPRVSGSSAADWKRDVEVLEAVHQRLRAAVVKALRIDAKLRWMIHGAAAHDLYHAGQIRLLRRLTADRKNRDVG
jgi:hypothetical protein